MIACSVPTNSLNFCPSKNSACKRLIKIEWSSWRAFFFGWRTDRIGDKKARNMWRFQKRHTKKLINQLEIKPWEQDKKQDSDIQGKALNRGEAEILGLNLPPPPPLVLRVSAGVAFQRVVLNPRYSRQQFLDLVPRHAGQKRGKRGGAGGGEGKKDLQRRGGVRRAWVSGEERRKCCMW